MSDVTHKHYRPSEWIDPRIEIQHSPIAGSGMFARVPINEGDTVERRRRLHRRVGVPLRLVPMPA